MERYAESTVPQPINDNAVSKIARPVYRYLRGKIANEITLMSQQREVYVPAWPGARMLLTVLCLPDTSQFVIGIVWPPHAGLQLRLYSLLVHAGNQTRIHCLPHHCTGDLY